MRRVRLNEKQLKQVVTESVRRMLNEIDLNNIDYSRTRGVKLPDKDYDWYLKPREIKTKISALQKALMDVMEMTNGNRAGDEFSQELFSECWKFYQFIGQYSSLDNDEKYADVPFIRTYDDDCSIQCYYDKEGNPIEDF